jgi:hypothetical protein
MPTNRPPKPEANVETTERKIAEFALEESRLSNLAYRFQLVPRERVWKNWERTEFEPNHFRVAGLVGVSLHRDESERAHRTASRALEDLDHIIFFVEDPAQSVIVKNPGGTSEIVNRPTLCVEIVARDAGAFDQAVEALDAAFPGGRVAGKIISEK